MPAGQNAVDALHFDKAPERGLASRWLDRLRGAPAAPVGPGASGAAGSMLPDRLRELRHWLCRQAERGVAREQASGALQELRTRIDAVSAIGLGAFARLSAVDVAPSRVLLRTHYVCLQYERLFDDERSPTAGEA